MNWPFAFITHCVSETHPLLHMAAVHFLYCSESHWMYQSVFSHFKTIKVCPASQLLHRAAVSISVSCCSVRAFLQATGLITHLRQIRQCLLGVPSALSREVQIGHHGTVSPTTESVPWNLVVVFIFISQSISNIYHVFHDINPSTSMPAFTRGPSIFTWTFSYP